MANLPESSNFDAGVYQIELTDPVIGGPSGVSNAPLKNLANRTKYLKDHVDALETSRAPLASPALTGTPTAPTAAAGTNTTQLATTAFVKTATENITAENALKLGGVLAAGYALKDSPSLTGNPTAPTAPIFDADITIANTDFVQRALGNYRGTQNMTAGDVLTNDAVGKVMYFGGATGNVTIPPLANVTPGSAITLKSYASPFTVTTTGTDQIYGRGTSLTTSLTVQSQEELTLVSNGAVWFAMGTAAMFALGSFALSKSINGYQKLPSGLLVQWGTTTFATAGDSEKSITFPVAFTQSVFYASWIMQGNSTSMLLVPMIRGITTTGMVLISDKQQDNSYTGDANWIAFGF